MTVVSIQLRSRAVVAAALVGLGACAVAALVAYWSLAGDLPARLYGEPASRLAAYIYFSGIPIELPMALVHATLAVAALVAVRGDRTLREDIYTVVFVAVIPFLALHVWVLLSRSRCIPLLVSAVATATLLALVALADQATSRGLSRRLAARALGRHPRRILIGGAVAAGMAILVLGILLVGHTSRLWAAAAQAEERQFIRWFDAQPRGLPSQAGRVQIVEFIDYQCPPCRQSFFDQRPIFEEYLRLSGGAVGLEMRDFPLEPECNAPLRHALHPAACEAAVAMHLARRKGVGAELEQWLYTHQAALSRDRIRAELGRFGLSDAFDREYDELLAVVKNDVARARAAGVTSTPTVFVNGVRLPGTLSDRQLRTVMEMEMRRAGVPVERNTEALR